MREKTVAIPPAAAGLAINMYVQPNTNAGHGPNPSRRKT
jgi:hypothetical protein